jgi:hypothetical protein
VIPIGGGLSSADYTTNYFDIPVPTMGSNGWYNVLITNTAGAVSNSPVQLVVENYPVVNSIAINGNASLSSITVAAGTSTTLSVAASPAGITYQWYHGTTAVGTSATLTLDGSSTNQCGSYSVTVANDVGSATSANLSVRVEDTPSIVAPLMTDTTIVAGQDYALTVAVSSEDTQVESYQWMKEISPGSENPSLDTALTGNVAPPGGHTYTISGASTRDSGTYYVLVKNLKTPAGTASGPVKISVDVSPVITTDLPSSINFLQNASGCLLGVYANGGSDLSYSWLSNGVSFAAATGSNVLINTTSTNTGTTFKVRVYNNAGTVNSSQATVNVLAAPAFTVDLAATATANKFYDYVLNVNVTNVPAPFLTYKWYKNGQQIAADAGYPNRLTLHQVAEADAGTYYATVSVTESIGGGAAPSVQTTPSTTQTLTVAALPVITQPPTPASYVTNKTGAQIDFTLATTVPAGNTLTYGWYHISGPGVTNQVPNTDLNAGLLAASGELKITRTPLTTNDSGQYYCVITNWIGTTMIGTVQSAMATVVIYDKPVFTPDSPGNVYLLDFESEMLSVTLASPASSFVTYQWYMDNTTKNGTSLTAIRGETNDALWLTGVQRSVDDGVVYAVQATDAEGSYPAVLATNWQVHVYTPPTTVTVTPSPSAVGGTVFLTNAVGPFTISAVTNAASSPCTYQWYKDGVSLGGSQSSRTLSIASPAGTDAGSYYVVATLSGGVSGQTLQSASVPVVVETPPGIGSVTLSPTTGFTNYGGTVQVTVSATGGNLKWYWYYNTGDALQDTLADQFTQNSTNANIWTWQAPNESAGAGQFSTNYYVVVTNETGIYSNKVGLGTVTLGTEESPTTVIKVLTNNVLTAASTVSVGKGIDLVLTNHATGDGVITYQWYKDGQAITGSNLSTLHISAPNISDSGVYYVDVDNELLEPQQSASITVQVVGAPGFIYSPTNRVVTPGSTVKFTASPVTVDSSMTFQWYLVGSPDTALSDGGEISGSATTNLTLTGVTQSDSGKYYLLAMNSASSTGIKSDAATLTVQAAPAWVTALTSPVIVAAGQPLALQAKASGDGIGYNWYKNPSLTVSNHGVINGGTGFDVYTISSSAQASQEGTYVLTVTNALGVGAAKTNSVTVEVPVAPTLNGLLGDRTIGSGTNGIFKLNYTAADAYSLTFAWYYSAVSKTDAGNAIPASNDVTLTVIASNPGSNGWYFARITDIAGVVVESDHAHLVVQNSATVTSPTGGGVMASNASSGLNLSYTYGGTGIGYQWQIKDPSAGYTNVTGQTGASFTTTTLSAGSAADGLSGDSGTYRVVVTNAVGTVNGADIVVNVVNAPFISAAGQPSSGTAAKDSYYTFSVAVANPNAQFITGYQWMKHALSNGLNTNSDTQVATTAGGVSTSAYRLQVEDSLYAYYVKVTDVAGTTASSMATAQMLTTPAFSPDLSASIADVSATNGQIVLTVGATGGNLTYQWYKDGNPLTFDPTRMTLVSSDLGSTLTVNSPVIADTGTYYVTVQNSTVQSPVASTHCSVLVVCLPVITTDLVGSTNQPGSAHTFSVQVNSAAIQDLTYDWQYTNGLGAWVDVAVQPNRNSYLIPSISSANAGMYRVKVINAAAPSGVISAMVPLVVESTPIVTTHLANQNCTAASGLHLEIDATGVGLGCQWMRNGVVIPGTVTAISGGDKFTYDVTSPAASTNNGRYSALVTNSIGQSAPMEFATVWVVSTPQILIPPANASVGVGSNYTLTVTVAKATTNGLGYQWQAGSTNITGATSNYLTLNGVSLADSGTYTVLVTNAASLSGVSASAVLTVVDRPALTNVTASVIAAADSTFSLSATATGGNLNYVWTKGTSVLKDTGTHTGSPRRDTNISGATLTIYGALVTNSGTYTLTVSNTAGKITAPISPCWSCRSPSLRPIWQTAMSAPEATIRLPPRSGTPPTWRSVISGTR